MVTPKKNTKLAKRRRVMKAVDDNKAFYLKDGRKVKSIIDLAHALEKMGDDTFYNHVRDEQNDFSRWVEDVFGERKLSRQLQEVQSKTDAQIKILKHIVGGLS